MPINPFFSVCIPTYNYAQFLPEAIESVLHQRFGDYELLIQDNCSTDNTDEVVARFDDPRISYVKNSSNLGMFGNLNKVCARSRGKYIKVLCADDVLSEWCLETIYESLRREGFSHKLVSVRETSDRSQIARPPAAHPAEIFTINRDTLFPYLAQPDNWGAGLAELCVEREFFEAFGFFGEFDKDKDFSKDIITWLGMVLETEAMLISHPLVFQRPHAAQARYKLSRITQLREMLTFFYGRGPELTTCPGYERGRERYLERYVLSHYWYGIKAMLTGHGASYLLEVRSLLKEFGYRGFPWAVVMAKVQQRFPFRTELKAGQ